MSAQLDCLLISRGSLVIFAGIEKIIASFVIAFGIHCGPCTARAIAVRVATGISRVRIARAIIAGGGCSRMSRTNRTSGSLLFWGFVFVRLALRRRENALAEFRFNVCACQ